MKNVNTILLKAKFPSIKKNKKIYFSLIGKKQNINSLLSSISNYSKNNPPKSLPINSYNKHIQSIRLMKSIPPFILLGKNKALKQSSSDFFKTGLQNFQSNNVGLSPSIFLRTKLSDSLPIFKTQNSNKTNKNLRYKSLYSSNRNNKNKNDKKNDDDSPRLKYLGNLIKFKRNKKNLKKKKTKDIIPQEKRKDYFDFIDKKRKIFYSPKSTSHYAHEKSSDFLINSIKKTKSYQILETNYILKPKNPKEEIIEMRDTVPNLPFNTQKLISQIRNLFSQDYKFNYSQFNETFYNSFENRVNFIDDIYRVPIFKNNLVKIILTKKEPHGFEEWKNINVINNTTWNILNMVKTKLQREKDEKLKKEKELELKKKEEEETNFRKKKKKSKKEEKTEEKEKTEENDSNENNKSNSFEEESDNNKKIIKEEENYSNIMMNVEKEEQLKRQQYENLYIIEEYFLHKNNYDSGKVSIVSDKLRHLYFHRDEYRINTKEIFDN